MADPLKIAEALDYYDKIASKRASFNSEDGSIDAPMMPTPSIVGNLTPYEAMRLGQFNQAVNREAVGVGPFNFMGAFAPQSNDPTRSPEAEWRQKNASLSFGGDGASLGASLAGNSAMPRDQMFPTFMAGAGPVSALYAPIRTPMGKGAATGFGLDAGPVNVQAIKTTLPMMKPTTSYEATARLGDSQLQGSIEPRGGATFGAQYPVGDGTLSFTGSRGPRYEGNRDYNAMLRYNLRF